MSSTIRTRDIASTTAGEQPSGWREYILQPRGPFSYTVPENDGHSVKYYLDVGGSEVRVRHTVDCTGFDRLSWRLIKSRSSGNTVEFTVEGSEEHLIVRRRQGIRGWDLQCPRLPDSHWEILDNPDEDSDISYRPAMHESISKVKNGFIVRVYTEEVRESDLMVRIAAIMYASESRIQSS